MADALIHRLLARNPFFAGMRADDLLFLSEHASSQPLAAGQILFRHGDPAKHFYVIQSGVVTLEIAALEGPALELQRLGPDAVIGWSWLIPPYKWTFNARAEEPGEVLSIERIAVLERCEADLRFGYDLLRRFSALMSDRLAHARRRMMEEWRVPGFA